MAAVAADQFLTSAQDTETETCGNPGEWTAWSRWTGCSKSCGGGITTRVRYHQCDASSDEETQICNDVCCPAWNEWSEWTICSVSCGKGTQSRARDNVCIATIDPQQQTRACFATLPDDPYHMWSQWSVCSASCPGGRMSRRAEHICDAPAKVWILKATFDKR